MKYIITSSLSAIFTYLCGIALGVVSFGDLLTFVSSFGSGVETSCCQFPSTLPRNQPQLPKEMVLSYVFQESSFTIRRLHVPGSIDSLCWGITHPTFYRQSLIINQQLLG